jgi:hypothetical protein
MLGLWLEGQTVHQNLGPALLRGGLADPTQPVAPRADPESPTLGRRER